MVYQATPLSTNQTTPLKTNHGSKKWMNSKTGPNRRVLNIGNQKIYKHVQLWFSVPFEQIRQKFSGTLASLHLATGKDLERSWPRLAWPARDVFSVSSCQSLLTLNGCKKHIETCNWIYKSHSGILVFGRSFRDILKFVSDSSYKTLSKQIDQYLAMAQNDGTPQTYGPTYHKQKTITKNTTHQQESSLYSYKGNPSKWPYICIKFDPPPRMRELLGLCVELLFCLKH